jgi:hypothetical protein
VAAVTAVAPVTSMASVTAVASMASVTAVASMASKNSVMTRRPTAIDHITFNIFESIFEFFKLIIIINIFLKFSFIFSLDDNIVHKYTYVFTYELKL